MLEMKFDQIHQTIYEKRKKKTHSLFIHKFLFDYC